MGCALSRQEEPPFVQQELKPVQEKLAWEGLLPVHEVADEYEEHDEDVEMQRRGQEEVVREEQKRLSAVSTLDRPNNPRCFGGARMVCRDSESDGLAKSSHIYSGFRVV